jgi:hypothetical protein
MQSLRLTWYLLRVPKLFISLILFPVLLSIVIIVIQLISSALFLSYIHTSDTKRIEQNLDLPRRQSWFRKELLKSDDYAENLTVCYWENSRSNKSYSLLKKKIGCQIERYDIVIHPAVLKNRNEYEYIKLFLGLFRKVHICTDCISDIVISNSDGANQVDFRSLFALSLFSAVHVTDDYRSNYVRALKSVNNLEDLIGEKYLKLTGFIQTTKISTLASSLVLVANISIFILICLFLSLKAHRKVLDYFSHSGALLPLVAASGKNNFYLTIWSLTIFRVLAFTITALPLSIVILSGSTEESLLKLLFQGDIFLLILWLVTIITSLTLTTIIASLAELKTHSSLLSIKYKVIPLMICLLGGIVWTVTFIYETPVTYFLRDLIMTLPLFSIPGLLLCPVFAPHPLSLTINIILTLCFTIFTINRNARWFGSHLDEI